MKSNKNWMIPSIHINRYRASPKLVKWPGVVTPKTTFHDTLTIFNFQFARSSMPTRTARLREWIPYPDGAEEQLIRPSGINVRYHLYVWKFNFERSDSSEQIRMSITSTQNKGYLWPQKRREFLARVELHFWCNYECRFLCLEAQTVIMISSITADHDHSSSSSTFFRGWCENASIILVFDSIEMQAFNCRS
jgi:hypothetical protein